MGEAKRRQAEIDRLKRAMGATGAVKNDGLRKAVSSGHVIVVPEKGLAEHIDEVRQAVKAYPDTTVLVFPEALRSKAKSENPDVEFVVAMQRYCRAHPELELPVFEM